MKNLFLGMFVAIYSVFLLMDSYSWGITQEYETNLKNADIIGISRKLPEGLGRSFSFQESSGRANAVGKNNTDTLSSFGLCQINELYEKYLANLYLPGGYKEYDRSNPIHSALIGCGYLRDLHKQFSSWEKALWAYNWGPGNVSKIKSINDVPAKVRLYASQILSRIPAKKTIVFNDKKIALFHKDFFRHYERVLHESDDLRKYLVLKSVSYFVNNNISNKTTRNTNKNLI